MRKKLKLIAFLVAAGMICAILVSPIQAQEAGEIKSYTIEEAIKTGLENSITLKQIKNQIDISELADKKAKYNKKKLDDASEKISKAKDSINEAEKLLDENVLPVDVTLPGLGTISKGTDLDDLNLDEATKSAIKSGVRQKLEESSNMLDSGENKLEEALKEAGVTLGDKLNFSDLGSLTVKDTGDLMTTMTGIQSELTKASYDIYKSQIAMLIQKSYYDALKAEKMLEVKKKAMERGERQYNFTKEGYEKGMKAKDDVLLANIYYIGTKLEYQKAEGEYKNALIELKKNMNIPLDTEIKLEDVIIEDVIEENLEEGLASGLKNRLEIKKAVGEFTIYQLNFNITKRKYPKITFQYKEAELLKEKAAQALEAVSLEVESSIRQSFENMNTAGQMLKEAKLMVEQAQESLEIAEYKYKEGFAIEDNPLLKKLNIEASAGTIVEVLAAEENLSQIEQNVVEIAYSYNLARVKYLNDIGKTLY